MFESYEEMKNWLEARRRKADMDAVSTFLEECVTKEAAHLARVEMQNTGRKKTSAKLKDKCRKEAEEHFAEDVSVMLNSDNDELSPWAVITYRRKSKAWAIAGAISQRMDREEMEDSYGE